MGDTWTKIKLWAKIIVGVLLATYAGLFLYNNSYDVDFWYWPHHYPKVSAAFLAMSAFVAGAVFALVVSTTLRTMRTMRASQSGRRLERLERDQAELRAKAARLATQPAPAAVPAVVAAPPPAATGEGVTFRVESLGGGDK